MTRTGLLVCALVALLTSCSSKTSSGLYVEPGLRAEIAQIHAIDNHAHPQRLTSATEEDREFDALPADAIQDISFPEPFQQGDALYSPAWQSLFAFEYSAGADLKAAKDKRKKEKGDLYPSWVLNQVNTDVMLANRTAMGPSLPADRFKWVPFVDMFLFPLSNASIKAKDSEHKAFLDGEEKLLARYVSASEGKRLPASFDDYLTLISHQLESWKSQGAVGVKFELAYLRDLQISDPQKQTADRIYSIYLQSSEPSTEEYKVVQDYVFRYIAAQAGRLGMPVQIHCSIGAGSYFKEANANPLQLESVFNDPSLRRTKFVMLHGGWPFSREAAALILKPNVYVDFSAFSYFAYPAQAARAIRLYLESAPNKVLYGSDASPISDHVGWEETLWIASRNGRLALGLALTEMEQDGEITSERALQLARMALRENARNLYGL